MKCIKCGSELNIDMNFCPYCGEKMSNNDTYKTDDSYYDDPFKDIRIDTHGSQFQYQQNYSKITNSSEDILNKKPKNNKTLIGLIGCFLAIFVGLFNGFLGITFAIISLVFVIMGIKYTSKIFGTFAFTVTIFNFMIALIVSIFIIIGDIKITYDNGYETTIKKDFINTFLSMYYVNKLDGYWINDSNELLYFDKNNYSIYIDKDNFDDNYYYGKYSLDNGLDFGNDTILYGDDEYYYYRINTFDNYIKYNGTIYDNTISMIEKGFTLKLNKKSKDKLILVFNDNNTEMSFSKNDK